MDQFSCSQVSLANPKFFILLLFCRLDYIRILYCKTFLNNEIFTIRHFVSMLLTTFFSSQISLFEKNFYCYVFSFFLFASQNQAFHTDQKLYILTHY